MKNLSILLLVTLLLTSCGKVVNNDIEKTTQEEKETQISEDKIANNNSDTAMKNIVDEELQGIETPLVELALFEGKTIYAFMDTSYGLIKLELFTKQAPKTTANFAIHAQNGYYDNLTFHRVINNFMIQGGDPLGTGVGGESIYGPKFEDEFFDKIENEPGTIVMANSGPNTNGSQFFINEVYNRHLDGKHTVFGNVIEGFSVVESITDIPLDNQTGLPNDTAKIKSVKLYTKNNDKFIDYIISDTDTEKNNAINNYNFLLKEIDNVKNAKILEKSEINKNRIAKSRDLVGVKYNLTLADGTQVDGNLDSDNAFEFIVDQDGIIVGFSKALKGMKIGDKKSIELNPEEAYGAYDETNTKSIPKHMLKTFVDAGIKLEKGNTLPTERGNFLIKDVTETDVIIDINHSLAGKVLNFEIELKYFVN